MNRWFSIRVEYANWLRSFPLLSSIGQPGDSPELVPVADAPEYLNFSFWSARSHEIESLAREQLADAEIDQIFDEVVAVINEDLRRFDPLIVYFDRFCDDLGTRFDDEIEMALSVKRDLAWAAIERTIGLPGFFTQLAAWYGKGRWPFNWVGDYPLGHVQVI